MAPIVNTLARALFAAVLLNSGSLVVAQPASPAAPPSLAQAVDAAWQRATESVETEGQVRRARADHVSAAALWAAPPAIELAHRDSRLLTDASARETDIGLVVPLWLPGQQNARLESTRAGDEAARAARDAARLRIAGLVREAVWNVKLARAEVELAQAQTEAIEALAADVDRRVAAGDLARADALAARAEAAASAAARTRARARLQVSLTRWQALSGLADIPEDETGIEPATGNLSDEHPMLRSARRNVELAIKRWNAVNASRRSPPELLARLRREASSGSQSSQHSIGIGLRVALATDDRNAPLLAAAAAELDAAVATEQRLRRQLLADVEASRAETEAATLQITAQQTRVRLLRERAALLDKSFQAGETSLPEMLRVLSAVAQGEAALQRQRADAGLARARLEQALGNEP